MNISLIYFDIALYRTNIIILCYFRYQIQVLLGLKLESLLVTDNYETDENKLDQVFLYGLLQKTC